VHDRGLTDKTTVRLMTGAGLKVLRLTVKDGVTESVRVDMGEPMLVPALIPVDLPGETAMDVPLTVEGRTFRLNCVSMGNPHCVLFVDDPDAEDLPRWGSLLEKHPVFPRHANIEFVHVDDRGHIRQRTWERGSGETLACGTGASAVMVASAFTGRTDRQAEITLRGGKLLVEWAEDGHVYQQGPAAFVFDGEWNG